MRSAILVLLSLTLLSCTKTNEPLVIKNTTWLLANIDTPNGKLVSEYDHI